MPYPTDYRTRADYRTLRWYDPPVPHPTRLPPRHPSWNRRRTLWIWALVIALAALNFPIWSYVSLHM